MSDKIRQAIDEIELEVSDSERFHMEPDIKERLANKIAGFLAKGVGNPSVVYDVLRKAHDDGKYPAATPQGRGENIRSYTDRIMAMFSVSSGTMKLQTEGAKKMLVMAHGTASELTDKQKAQAYETPEPIVPKAIEVRMAKGGDTGMNAVLDDIQ